MSVLKFSLVVTLLLILTSHFVSETFAKTNEDMTPSTLADAEEAMVSAYREVLKAEEAGANVTSLLVQLDKAGEFLSRAHMTNSSADFNDAASLAREVQNAAIELKNSALNESMQRTLFTMMASVAGIALIALGSLWVWHLLKKRYSTSGFPKSN